MKISEAFDMYRNEVIRIKYQSNRTEEMHEYVRGSLSSFLFDKDIQDLTLDDVHEWISFLSNTRSQNTIRGYILKVRLVLKYCHVRGVKCLEPELILVPKRIEPVPVWCSPEDINLLIDSAFSDRDKFIISLLYSSGIRISEMISLNRGQIVNREFVVRGKGDKVRPCFIDSRTEKLMNQYLSNRTDRESALVISSYGGRITRGTVEYQMRKIAERAGLSGKRITPHTMRHSFSTNFIDNGGSIRDLSRLLGHANLSVTSVYTHIKDADLKMSHLKYHTI